ESISLELFLNGPMETFTDSVGLRAFSFCFAMVYILDGEIELVFVVFPCTAIFRPPIGQHPEQPEVVFLIKGYHAVIEHIGSYQCVFTVIQLGEGHFGIGVDKRLLINMAYTLDVPDVIGVLRTKVTRMVG